MDVRFQVPKLEICKQLKEAGYPQKGLFWYSCLQWGGSFDGEFEMNKNDYQLQYGRRLWGVPTDKERKNTLDVVAPTVAELGQILSVFRFDGGDYSKRHIKYDRPVWRTDKRVISCYWSSFMREGKEVYGETEADVRAKMIVWLNTHHATNFLKECALCENSVVHMPKECWKVNKNLCPLDVPKLVSNVTT